MELTNYTNIMMVMFTGVLAAMALGRWLLSFRTGTSEKRRQMIEQAVDRLVDGAEHYYKDQPKSGQSKFAWVMSKLRARFGTENPTDLEDMIKASVYRQDQARANRQTIVIATPLPVDKSKGDGQNGG